MVDREAVTERVRQDAHTHTTIEEGSHHLNTTQLGDCGLVEGGVELAGADRYRQSRHKQAAAVVAADARDNRVRMYVLSAHCTVTPTDQGS